MPEYDREPRHTLAADEAHLDGLATIGNDRGKAALGEIALMGLWRRSSTLRRGRSACSTQGSISRARREIAVRE